MTWWVGIYTTCVPNPTWNVISCDSKFYWGRPVRYGKKWSFALRRHATNGSHLAVSRHVLSFLLSFEEKRDFNILNKFLFEYPEQLWLRKSALRWPVQACAKYCLQVDYCNAILTETADVQNKRQYLVATVTNFSGKPPKITIATVLLGNRLFQNVSEKSSPPFQDW